MIYSRFAGWGEAAEIVFAFNSREAKKMGWHMYDNLDIDGYVDLGVKLIKNNPEVYAYGNQDKLLNNIPHYVNSPDGCNDCFVWGAGVNENGICDNCGGVSGFNRELIDLMIAWQTGVYRWNK